MSIIKYIYSCICVFVQAAICVDFVAVLQEQRTCNMTHSDTTVWRIRQFLNMCVYIYLSCKMCMYIYMLVQAATCGDVVAALQAKRTRHSTHLDVIVSCIRQFLNTYMNIYIYYTKYAFILYVCAGGFLRRCCRGAQEKGSCDITHFDVVDSYIRLFLNMYIYISILYKICMYVYTYLRRQLFAAMLLQCRKKNARLMWLSDVTASYRRKFLNMYIYVYIYIIQNMYIRIYVSAGCCLRRCCPGAARKTRVMWPL